MDEGVIIRSVIILVKKLYEYYKNSIVSRMMDQAGAFIHSLLDGSAIVRYFRSYRPHRSHPYWEDSVIMKSLETFFQKATGMLNGFAAACRRASDGSSILTWLGKADRRASGPLAFLAALIKKSLIFKVVRYCFRNAE